MARSTLVNRCAAIVVGDNCDGVVDEGLPDTDGDGVRNDCDNCPYDINVDDGKCTQV